MRAPTGAPTVDDDVVDRLKALGEAAAVFTALAFVAGWSYLSSYYSAFGIGLFDLDLSIPLASIFAMRVVYRSKWLLVLVLLLTVLGAGYRKLPLLKKINVPMPPNLIILLLVCLFGYLLAEAGSAVGRDSAEADMLAATSQLPSVAFLTKLKADYPLPTCLTDNTLDCLLLAHSQHFYYFFEPFLDRDQTSSSRHSNSVQLYSFPESEVELVRTQRSVAN